MVGHAVVGEVVRADALGARAARLDLRAHRIVLLSPLLRLVRLDPRGEDPHRRRAVLVLRALVLAVDLDARRLVRDAHRAVGRVDVLPARAARSEGLYDEIGLLNLLAAAASAAAARSAAGSDDGRCDVCTRPKLSVAGTRWTRCTPLSARSMP